MARAFLKVYFDFEERTEELNDVEKGRLLLAMLRYACAGEMPTLGGNERFCFPTFKKDIDRDAQAYASKAANGQKGGWKAHESRAKFVADCSESKRNLADCSESERTQAKSTETERPSYSYYCSCSSSSVSSETPKDQEGNNSDRPFLSDEDALEISALHERLYQAAKRAGLSANENSISDAAMLVQEYGEEAVFRAMKKTAKSRLQSWPYVEGILRNEKAGGKPQGKLWYEPTEDAPKGMVVL